jgi:hypothetical protein
MRMIGEPPEPERLLGCGITRGAGAGEEMVGAGADILGAAEGAGLLMRGPGAGEETRGAGAGDETRGAGAGEGEGAEDPPRPMLPMRLMPLPASDWRPPPRRSCWAIAGDTIAVEPTTASIRLATSAWEFFSLREAPCNIFVLIAALASGAYLKAGGLIP